MGFRCDSDGHESPAVQGTQAPSQESACNARDVGSIPGLGRFPGLPRAHLRCVGYTPKPILLDQPEKPSLGFKTF